MKRTILASAAALALSVAAAQAAVITISGTAGQGFSTVSLSGTAQVRGAGTIRDASAGTFNTEDTLEYALGGVGYLADTSIQDELAALTGNLQLTTNDTTLDIVSLFLDDDDGVSGCDDCDDFGFRASSAYGYSVLNDGAWQFSGSATFGVDFGAFTVGSYSGALFNQEFAAGDQVSLQIVDTAAPVPLPASVTLLLAGIGGLGAMARRRARKA